MGVVRMYRCGYLVGVVRRYIDFFIILIIPTPLVLAIFLQLHPYFFVHFKMFCRSCLQ